MIQNFKAYDLAVQFYREAKGIKAPRHLKDQLLRAASSIALNLSEGSAKPTWPDKIRFYAIAFGSTREVQSILDLLECTNPALIQKLDELAAVLYVLVYKNRKQQTENRKQKTDL